MIRTTFVLLALMLVPTALADPMEDWREFVPEPALEEPLAPVVGVLDTYLPRSDDDDGRGVVCDLLFRDPWYCRQIHPLPRYLP